MEKDLKVDSNMPLSNSSQEVTKDLLDMIGEYKGHTCPLLGRTGPSRRPLSRQVSLKNKPTLSVLIRSTWCLFCPRQALCTGPSGS